MPRPVYDKLRARIYREWLALPAWRTLNTNARALLAERLASYRPHEPNRFEPGGRPAAAQALNDIEVRGWLEVVRVGKMRGLKAGRASAFVRCPKSARRVSKLYRSPGRAFIPAIAYGPSPTPARAASTNATAPCAAATRSGRRRERSAHGQLAGASVRRAARLPTLPAYACIGAGLCPTSGLAARMIRVRT